MAKNPCLLNTNAKHIAIDGFSIPTFIVFQVPFCEREGAESSITDVVTNSVQLDCSGVGSTAKIVSNSDKIWW